MLKSLRSTAVIAVGLLCLAPLSACSSGPFGGKKASESSERKVAPNMGVNSYLWRASLETLEFMPLDQVDPFGGVIITDWYSGTEAPGERLKANVYILDANLRADALKVSVFRQVRSGSQWTDAAVDADTARQVENAILTRARELYIATVDNS